MVHLKHTSVTDGAVMHSGWFDFFAAMAFLFPPDPQLVHSLGTIFEQGFYVGTQAVKAIVVLLELELFA
jgi:hypothetical protein